MNYIVSAIINSIRAQHPSRDKQLRVRLSGFENVQIYHKVCEYLCSEYRDLDLIVKLSTEKYNYFKATGADSAALNAMEKSGWIAGEKSLTYFRNLPQDNAQLIVLMGTEAVDDQGGLSDLYYIDPSRLVSELHGEYHRLFAPRKEELDADLAVVIDKLYKDLFALVPLNICKLSDMVDTWEYIYSPEQFVEKFYESLPEWGLCKDSPLTVTISQITKSKKNLLQGNYDFITRKAFRKMSKSQYQKYLKNLDIYPQEEKAIFTPEWEGWPNQKLDSYDKLAASLREYVCGQNLEQQRELLKYVDYTIVNHILNLKVVTTVTPKPKKVSVNGSPLSAMTHALYAVAGAADDTAFNGISINISSVELADAIDPQSTATEDEQIFAAWRNLCFAAGGIFDYIQSRGIEVDGDQIDIIVDPENIFSPASAGVNVAQGIVSAASANKKLCKMHFEISRCLDGKLIKEPVTKCEWTFALSDGWYHAFDGICAYYEQWCEKKIDSILPLFQIENYERLVSSKSEEEFLDVLDNSKLLCDIDLLRFINHKATDPSSQKWHAEFYALGTAFVDCCRSIYENGFFGDIVKTGDSKVNAFIDAYVKLGNKIIKSSFTSGMEWVFNCYIHAFAIENSGNSVIHDEVQTNCIVPPFHPAILQKRVDQSVFLYDGCREIMLNRTKKTPLKQICDAIDGLEEMSEIHEGLDIFPGKGSFFGSTRSFSDYCICGSVSTSIKALFEGVHKKDAVFDDDFSSASCKRIDDSSRMYLDIIDTYLKALPNSRFNMSITVVNPGDLQPIVAAVYNHIINQKEYLTEHADEYSEAQRISVQLHILVKPEDKGGKNYLTYWVNTFFSEDENVDVKVYLNEWDNKDTLLRLLNPQTDIIFLQDILMLDRLVFIKDSAPSTIQLDECRFPIVFKPLPVMKGSVKRLVELTQKQFSASTIHSQVVSYANDYDTYGYRKSAVSKQLSIDKERRELILNLHEYSNWVVCVDSGMDGALLRDDVSRGSYSIIGFSTGKGRQGQYNLTITARSTIIDAVNAKLKSRLKLAFQWSDEKIKKATAHCMEEAKKLDGVSLLSAINPRDYKINEFLAYVLTSEEVSRMSVDTGVRVLIHLDSYPHWFVHTKTSDDDSNSRPDFLLVTANVNDDRSIELDAKIIECKLAKYGASDVHKAKARKQVEHGIARLAKLFDPNSKSIRRRYWYAQLYRALSFAQITFSADEKDFIKYSEGMRGILEGNFTIKWSGCILGYWKDLNGDTETVFTDPDNPDIEVHDIPQLAIQRMLLGDAAAEVSFADVPASFTDEEEEYDAEIKEMISRFESEEDSTYPELDNVVEPKVIEVAPVQVEPTSVVPDGRKPAETPEEPSEPKDPVVEPVNTVPSKPEKVSLEDVRVYIGKDRTGNKVYWEFGNPKLANRHLLITGTSGQGKTYSIQTMLKELSENGVPAVIFDYTEGFRLDQLDPKFTAALEGKLEQKIIYYTGVPINPFARHEIEIAGMKMREKASDVAQRIANIFAHVYKFGDQQFSAIYTACRAGIEQYGDAMTMNRFREKLEEEKNPASKTVLSKMAPFLDSAEFVNDPDFDWEKVIHSDGTVTVIQLTNFVREIQVIITEMMLWDAWHYNKKYGNKDTPFVVVLDEAQNLSHKAASPSAMILTEGRKFGWSAWFATQSLKVLESDEIVRLQQSAFKLYFKPTDEEIPTVAKSIDPSGGASSWSNTLKGLRKGQAITIGDRNRPDGVFGHMNPTVVGIASFEDRKDETK